MPNGQKYEEWLKSKGSEEGGENSGFTKYGFKNQGQCIKAIKKVR